MFEILDARLDSRRPVIDLDLGLGGRRSRLAGGLGPHVPRFGERITLAIDYGECSAGKQYGSGRRRSVDETFECRCVHHGVFLAVWDENYLAGAGAAGTG